jgi:hypothetical protein
MSRIDPVSTVAIAFLLALIALTSWARNEQTGATVAMWGEATLDLAPLCPKATDGHRLKTLC